MRNEHRYGAAELKRNYNRYLAIALVCSVVLHVAVILLVIFDQGDADGRVSITLADLPKPPVDTTWVLISMEPDNGTKPGREGGGAPDVKQPPGPSSKGHPEATPDRTHDRVDPDRTVVPKNPTNVRPVRDPKPPHPAGNTHDTSRVTDLTGTRGQRPDGQGDRPSGGSGGRGIGVGVASGMGNRGWLVRPNAVYPHGTNATGTVTLRFTVMPNGDITNIVPLKQADRALVNAAISGLRRAKARPLPVGVDQRPQNAIIPFTFELR